MNRSSSESSLLRTTPPYEIAQVRRFIGERNDGAFSRQYYSADKSENIAALILFIIASISRLMYAKYPYYDRRRTG